MSEPISERNADGTVVLVRVAAYTAQAGDFLWKIGQSFGRAMPLDDMIKANPNISDPTKPLPVGDVVNIPGLLLDDKIVRTAIYCVRNFDVDAGPGYDLTLEVLAKAFDVPQPIPNQLALWRVESANSQIPGVDNINPGINVNIPQCVRCQD